MSLNVLIRKSAMFVLCCIGGAFLVLSSALSGIGLAPKLWEILTSSPITNYELLYTLLMFSSIFVAGGGIALIIGAFVDVFDQGKIGVIICGAGTIIGGIFVLICTLTMNRAFEPSYGEIYLLFYDDSSFFGYVGALISFIGTLLSLLKNKINFKS